MAEKTQTMQELLDSLRDPQIEEAPAPQWGVGEGGNIYLENPNQTFQDLLDNLHSNQQNEERPFEPLELGPAKDITRENLLQDSSFMRDVREFLAKRVNESFVDNEDAYNRYLEHMRARINTVVTWQDWKYAQNASQDEKVQMARLYQTHDILQGQTPWYKAEGERFGLAGKAWDYGAAALWDPANLAAAYTGGAGKLAAIYATKGLRFTIKHYLQSSLARGLVGAGIEGAAGAVHGAATELTNKEIGRGGDWKQGAITGGLVGAAFGGVLGGGFAAATNRSAYRAATKIRLGREAGVAADDAYRAVANTLADETLKRGDKETVDFVQEAVGELRRLDEEAVEVGDTLLQDTRYARLHPDEVKRMTAAASEVAHLALKRFPKELSDPKMRQGDKIRITIQKGFVSTEELQDIASRFDVSVSEMAYIFLAEVSRAGKILRATQAWQPRQEQVDAMLKDISSGRSITPLTGTPAVDKAVEGFGRAGNLTWDLLQNTTKLRLGLMTSALATTMRNIQNVTIRLPMYMLEAAFMGGGPGATFIGRLGDVAKTPYHVLNSGDATALRLAYGQVDSETSKNAQRLFRQAADIEASTGSFSFLGNLGRKVNFVNTAVDNSIKGGIFLSEMRRVAGGTRALNRIISGKGVDAKGVPITFDRWVKGNQEGIDDALQNVLETVYQGDYGKGTLGARFIEFAARSKFAPFVTLVVPFARFLVQSLEFQARHVPLIGMLGPGSWRTYDYQAGKAVFGRGLLGQTQSKWKQVKGVKLTREQKLEVKDFNKHLAQTLSGSALLFGALQWKALQGPDLSWHETRINGKDYDILAWLGPFSLHAFAADWLYRKFAGNLGAATPYTFITKPEDLNFDKLITPSIVKNAKQVLFGLRGRGLQNAKTAVDNLIQGFADYDGDLENPDEMGTQRWKRFVADIASDYFNAFTIPVTMIRDFIAGFDPKGRVIMETDRIDIWEYFYNQALRSLPNTESVRNLETFLGITKGTPMANWLRQVRSSDLPPWARATPQGRRDIKTLQTNLALNEHPDPTRITDQLPSRASTYEGELTRGTDILRQVYGLTSNYPNSVKPDLDRLLTRLGVTRRKWEGNRIPDPVLWTEYKRELSKYAGTLLRFVRQDDRYLAAETHAERMVILWDPKIGILPALRTRIRKDVLDKVEPRRAARVRFASLHKDTRQYLQEKYFEVYQIPFTEDIREDDRFFRWAAIMNLASRRK